MFFFLSCNCFVQSSIIKIRLIFIKTGKSISLLKSNLKRAEVKMVPIDEYYKIL